MFPIIVRRYCDVCHVPWKGVGDRYRCTAGCDYDMCETCWVKLDAAHRKQWSERVRSHDGAGAGSTWPQVAWEVEVSGYDGLHVHEALMGVYMPLPGRTVHGAPLYRHRESAEHYLFVSSGSGKWVLTMGEENFADNLGYLRLACEDGPSPAATIPFAS